MKEELLKIQ